MVRNHAPIYSWSRCCAEWELGRIEGQRQVGITRGWHGQFKSLKPNAKAEPRR